MAEMMPVDGQVLELALVVGDALLAQQIDDEGAEHQGRQGVHGVVSLPGSPFTKGTILVVTGGGRHGAFAAR